ncbi:MAG: hypothetical protein ACR2M4_13700 [Actinomycetota bacterium]
MRQVIAGSLISGLGAAFIFTEALVRSLDSEALFWIGFSLLATGLLFTLTTVRKTEGKMPFALHWLISCFVLLAIMLVLGRPDPGELPVIAGISIGGGLIAVRATRRWESGRGD